MYLDYKKEREGVEGIENQYGFIMYLINDDECYIDSIYVKPEFRNSRKGTELVNQVATIARDNGCKYLVAKNYPKAFGSTESLKASLAYGFKVFACNSEFLTLAKEL